MTEETATPVEAPATEKKERYVRPKYVVALYKSGITKMEDLMAAVRAHEQTVDLKKNVKHPRDDYFYKRNIHWALSDATKAGEIEGYLIKRRKPKAKTTPIETAIADAQPVATEAAATETPVNNSEEIPTI